MENKNIGLQLMPVPQPRALEPRFLACCLHGGSVLRQGPFLTCSHAQDTCGHWSSGSWAPRCSCTGPASTVWSAQKPEVLNSVSKPLTPSRAHALRAKTKTRWPVISLAMGTLSALAWGQGQAGPREGSREDAPLPCICLQAHSAPFPPQSQQLGRWPPSCELDLVDATGDH